MESRSAEKQLALFIDKFTPEMAARIRRARATMRKRLPHAIEMVYDNYNFFVIGYGPTDRPSEAIFSLAAQAKGLSLCFLQGAGLPDPRGLLRGSGNVVRNIPLDDDSVLEHPDVRALISVALDHATVSMPADGTHRLLIKSVSAKQRPRRSEAPAAPTADRTTKPIKRAITKAAETTAKTTARRAPKKVVKKNVKKR
jgi:hypothetical protein